MGSGGKRGKGVPKSATDRPTKKDVRTESQGSDHYPSWRFSTVDKGGPFPWPVGTEIELQILGKLHQFDSMRWADIVGRDHHFIALDKLSSEAKQRLAEINYDDIDGVFSFHFSGKPRIIGIRILALVKLLWWDPEHLVCPSPLKNT